MEVRLKAVVRDIGTKGELNDLRSQGNVPAVYYGRKIEAVSMYVDEKEFRKTMGTDAGSNVIIDLKIVPPKGKDGSKMPKLEGKQTVVVKDMQRDPIKGDIVHIDFLKISMDEEIETTVPVVLVGESAGVVLGGVVQHSIRELNVSCLPKNLPENIEVDVTELEIGDNIHVSDISSIEGVEILDRPREMIVSVVPPTKVEEPEVEVEEEEEEMEEPEVIGEEKEEEKEEEEEPKQKERD